MSGYIYELSDWPKFHWDEGALADKLADVRYRQGRLIGRMEGLGFSLREEASLHSLTQDVLKSSEIEGEILNGDQVRSSIARRLGIDIGALASTDRNIEGVVEMMLDATQKYAEPLTRERLFGWQAALFPTGYSGMVQIRTGDWRDDAHGPMRVISGPIGREWIHYQAPPANLIDGEMTQFLNWFNYGEPIDPVLKSALAHLWFVTIHPFSDGNGRIARALADLALARSEGTPQRFYSMSAQIRLERQAYYDMLEATQSGSLDVTLWLDWFLGCLGRAFNGAEETLAAVLKKANFWERNAAVSFNDRQRLLLNKLLDGFDGKLTSSKWAKIAKCSPDTALRDIQHLVEHGILVKDFAGGRSTNYSLDDAVE